MKDLNNKKRILIGKVVSKKMQKTVTTETEVTYQDKRVHKTVRKVKKFQVHDENEIAKVGDFIRFYECAPISKTKFMMLKEVVSNDKKLSGEL